jgi:putative hydrolase of the HAD superfamily
MARLPKAKTFDSLNSSPNKASKTQFKIPCGSDALRYRENLMIDWSEIKTVFFDMDGTLLDLHFDNYFWLEHLPKRFTELKKIPHEQTLHKLHDMFARYQGSLNWYCLDFWSDELGIDIVELKREVSDRIAYRPHVKQFLSELHKMGLELAILTNAHRGSINLKLEQTDLAHYFDEIICSHDYGAAKESEDFWMRLHDTRPFDPARTAFFDDNESVLAAAKAFGIVHLYSIAQPDSKKATRTQTQFPLVYDFLELLPEPMQAVALPAENGIQTK